VGIPAECMVFLLMGGAYLRSRIKQAGKWDQETIVSFFLCQYCSGEYLREKGRETTVDRLFFVTRIINVFREAKLKIMTKRT
ncbi:hypothetical protein, partial [Klebsiella quasipneumoniae]